MCCRVGAATGLGREDGLDHLLSQSTFASYARRGIDLLIDLADPEPALNELAQRLGRRRKPECSLRRLNAASGKKRNLPSEEALRDALTPPLVRQLCELYLQVGRVSVSSVAALTTAATSVAFLRPL